jgi:ACS family glucarate transporter-like MFS transporter
MRERGLANGINFSGGRLGAAFALPVVAWMVERWGWRETFGLLMLVGFVWALVWYWWFRDDPVEHPGMGVEERAFILANRQQATGSPDVGLRFSTMARSRNMWYAMAQYFCSNFTFFFCLTWLFPHLKKTYQLDSVAAGWYASIPLVGGALGNVVAGWLIDWIYRRDHWKLSRQVPAMIGFALAAIGLVVSVYMQTAIGAVAWLTVAIFGADMTLAPSWSFCVDIGRQNSGAVSGTMNMAGNLGSFVTALAFPYLLEWTGNPKVFFFVGTGLNVLAIAVWLLVKPARPCEEF